MLQPAGTARFCKRLTHRLGMAHSVLPAFQTQGAPRPQEASRERRGLSCWVLAEDCVRAAPTPSFILLPPGLLSQMGKLRPREEKRVAMSVRLPPGSGSEHALFSVDILEDCPVWQGDRQVHR